MVTITFTDVAIIVFLLIVFIFVQVARNFEKWNEEKKEDEK